MMLTDKAVKGGLVVLRGTAWHVGDPGIELGLERIDIPAWEVVANAFDDIGR